MLLSSTQKFSLVHLCQCIPLLLIYLVDAIFLIKRPSVLDTVMPDDNIYTKSNYHIAGKAVKPSIYDSYIGIGNFQCTTVQLMRI